MFTIIVLIWNYPDIALGFLRFLACGIGTNKAIYKKITDFFKPIKDLFFLLMFDFLNNILFFKAILSISRHILLQRTLHSKKNVTDVKLLLKIISYPPVEEFE